MAARKQASARQQCTSTEAEGGHHVPDSDFSAFANFDGIREHLLDISAVLQTLAGLDEHCPLSSEELRRVARVMERINDQALAAATQGADYYTQLRWGSEGVRS